MDIMLFAAGCGAIVHCYSGYNGLHRDVFKSKYLNVLDFVFGNTGEAVIPGAGSLLLKAAADNWKLCCGPSISRED